MCSIYHIGVIECWKHDIGKKRIHGQNCCIFIETRKDMLSFERKNSLYDNNNLSSKFAHLHPHAALMQERNTLWSVTVLQNISMFSKLYWASPHSEIVARPLRHSLISRLRDLMVRLLSCVRIDISHYDVFVETMLPFSFLQGIMTTRTSKEKLGHFCLEQ